MAKRENERIVRKMFEATNRRDMDAYMSHFADDFIFARATSKEDLTLKITNF